jgi:tRNA modification GTPase
LTPAGAAALAVVAVRGPRAWDIARSLFQPRRKNTELPNEPSEGQFWLGRFGSDIGDEAILAVRKTGPLPCIEVHCHGGRENVRLMLETLASRGVRVCSTWQEFERLTGENPLQVQALWSLTQAPTVRTAAIVLDQAQGAFQQAIDEIIQQLRAGDVASATDRLATLQQYSAVGKHLITPWRVVIAGAANVGKSSLLNAIAGYQRCIVAPTPGTTRDVVTAMVALDGWPVELMDTAGMRSTAESLEAAGILLAKDAAASADLCLWVLDASQPPACPESPIEPLQYVINKIDLPAAWEFSQANGAITVSALAGTGIRALCDAIARRLVRDAPAEGTAVPFTPELCDAVETALAACREGRIEQAIHELAASVPLSI